MSSRSYSKVTSSHGGRRIVCTTMIQLALSQDGFVNDVVNDVQKCFEAVAAADVPAGIRTLLATQPHARKRIAAEMCNECHHGFECEMCGKAIMSHKRNSVFVADPSALYLQSVEAILCAACCVCSECTQDVRGTGLELIESPSGKPLCQDCAFFCQKCKTICPAKELNTTLKGGRDICERHCAHCHTTFSSHAEECRFENNESVYCRACFDAGKEHDD